MNDLTTEKTTTTKELAGILGVARDTINATVNRLELGGVLRQADIFKIINQITTAQI